MMEMALICHHHLSLVNCDFEYVIEIARGHRSRKTRQSTTNNFLISCTSYAREHNLWLPHVDVPQYVRLEYLAEQHERSTWLAAGVVEQADCARWLRGSLKGSQGHSRPTMPCFARCHIFVLEGFKGRAINEP